MNRMAGRGVICSGSIVHDTLVRPVDDFAWGTTKFVETIECHVGGNGANTSLTLATLGVAVRLLGKVGRDDQGRFALETLSSRGVNTQWVEIGEDATATTVGLVSANGARKFLHRMGASETVFPSPIEFTRDMTRGMSHYHLASVFMLPLLRRKAAEWLVAAHAAGLTTSLDTNWDPQGLWMQDLGPALPYVDTIFINEDEARMCTGTSDHALAAERLLAAGARCAVMKLGERGCAIYTGSEGIMCPAFDVEVRDTTGAGDCFVGGFLAALLEEATLADAGRFANAVAAFVVQEVGASTGLRPADEVREWMRSARVRSS